MRSVEIVDRLSPAYVLPMLLTGSQAFMARDIGSVSVEVADDPRFDGIVACQDPDLPGCRITQQQ
jgi:hypothetical protein